MKLTKLKKIIGGTVSAMMIAASIPTVASAADQQTRGNIGGYDYEMWNQNGQGQVSMNPGAGSFTCSWSNIENFLARMGKNYDSQKKNYKAFGNIVLTYDVEYTPRGNSYMCVYGWTRNPLMEYYIVEGWGDWRPPGNDGENKGTVTLNGNTYDIRKTMRYNQPSLDGTATFPQYWSVRKTSGSANNQTNYMKGTIDVSKHFDAWSKAGLDMSGTLYEVSLNIEGYRSNGSANVKSVTVSQGGSDSGQQQNNNNNQQNNNNNQNQGWDWNNQGNQNQGWDWNNQGNQNQGWDWNNQGNQNQGWDWNNQNQNNQWDWNNQWNNNNNNQWNGANNWDWNNQNNWNNQNQNNGWDWNNNNNWNNQNNGWDWNNQNQNNNWDWNNWNNNQNNQWDWNNQNNNNNWDWNNNNQWNNNNNNQWNGVNNWDWNNQNNWDWNNQNNNWNQNNDWNNQNNNQNQNNQWDWNNQNNNQNQNNQWDWNNQNNNNNWDWNNWGNQNNDWNNQSNNQWNGVVNNDWNNQNQNNNWNQNNGQQGGKDMNKSATMADDFRTGSSRYFIASDGWTNGDPFDCGWYKNQTAFRNGALELTIDKDYTGKYNYAGAEYRTNDFYGFGYYETSMQAIKNNGVVSSFFTYTGESDNNPWDEIDIEILGKDTTKVQFNYYTNGKADHEKLYDLGFDASQGFHTYGFDWQRDHITWYVDGKAVYTAYDNIPQTPGKIMMNTWPGKGVDDWLNHYDGRTPLTARYQWVTYNKQ